MIDNSLEKLYEASLKNFPYANEETLKVASYFFRIGYFKGLEDGANIEADASGASKGDSGPDKYEKRA